MRKVRNITVAVEPALYRQTRKLAAEYVVTVTDLVRFLLLTLPEAVKSARFPGGRPQFAYAAYRAQEAGRPWPPPLQDPSADPCMATDPAPLSNQAPPPSAPLIAAAAKSTPSTPPSLQSAEPEEAPFSSSTPVNPTQPYNFSTTCSRVIARHAGPVSQYSLPNQLPINALPATP